MRPCCRIGGNRRTDQVRTLSARWGGRSLTYDQFLYVDRIVVSLACQGQRLGGRMYDDLFAFARQSHAARVTCEFDIDPPNEASRRFHARYGFIEVGTRTHKFRS